MARGQKMGTPRAESQTLTSADGTSCSARRELRSLASSLLFCRVRATHLLCSRNARAFPFLPTALASVLY